MIQGRALYRYGIFDKNICIQHGHEKMASYKNYQIKILSNTKMAKIYSMY